MSSASGRGKPSRSASSVIVDKSVGYHDLKIDGYALTAGAPTASAKLRNFATGGSLGCALFAKTETLGRLAWARGGAGVESVRVHRCAAGGEPRRGPRTRTCCKCQRAVRAHRRRHGEEHPRARRAAPLRRPQGGVPGLPCRSGKPQSGNLHPWPATAVKQTLPSRLLADHAKIILVVLLKQYLDALFGCFVLTCLWNVPRVLCSDSEREEFKPLSLILNVHRAGKIQVRCTNSSSSTKKFSFLTKIR